MPTLGELRAILDHTGKPICDSSGVIVCGNCPTTACCDAPPCLRVTMDFRVSPSMVDEFTCPNTDPGPGDAYDHCYDAYPDMAFGVGALNVSLDALIPWVGAAQWPNTNFNYYDEWQVNDDSIYTPEQMAAFGAHPNSRFFNAICGDFHVMRAFVHVYCDLGDNSDSRLFLDIRYALRRMGYSGPSATNEAEARIIMRSKFNWGPPPTCDPVLWQQYGQDLTHEGFNCSDDGQGLIVQASATASFDPYCTITDFPDLVQRRLSLTWPCFKNIPVTVQEWNCDDVLPPIGIGLPPDPTPDWAYACCPDRQVITSPLGATITGVGTVPPIFLPGCDECLNGNFPFYFTQDVGNGKVGFNGTFQFGAPCLIDGYTEVVIHAYCADGVNWAAEAVFRGPGVPDIFIEADVIVAPCTDGYPENYFEVALNMNPGTNCFNGCPCFGGAYVIAGA